MRPVATPLRPRLALIAAVAENGVIGQDNALPWRMPSDLKHFKALTQFKPVIMGSRTWESLPRRPLHGRLNLVLSRNLQFEAEGAIVCETRLDALDIAREHAADDGASEVMVIGGAALYAAFLPDADRLYLTRIHASPKGDTVFPDIDKVKWKLVQTAQLTRDREDQYEATFETWDRVRS